MITRTRVIAMIFAVCLATACSQVSFAYLMPIAGDFLDTTGRTEVDCKSVLQGKTMVALVFGQSNSANHGETPYTPKKNVYNYFEGKCYVAADPMLGTTGSEGSVWSRLGDRLIDSGLYDNVLFITVGVGGTPVERWMSNGDLHLRLKYVLKQLRKDRIRVTHMFWHQGESDNGRKTSKEVYISRFMDMLAGLRAKGVKAPIYVAVATRCGDRQVNYEIQQAQRELVNTELGIYPGPDTDQLDLLVDRRHDACHFSEIGLDKHAELWLQAIKYSGR